jgi:hypothetical protein
MGALHILSVMESSSAVPAQIQISPATAAIAVPESRVQVNGLWQVESGLSPQRTHPKANRPMPKWQHCGVGSTARHSAMLASPTIRAVHYLGFGPLYLLGCVFDIAGDFAYPVAENRAANVIRQNNVQ